MLLKKAPLRVKEKLGFWDTCTMYNNVCSHVQRLLVSISHDQRFIESIVTLNNQRIDWYFVIFKITY